MRSLKFRAWDTESKCYVELNNLRGERSMHFSPYDLRAIPPEIRDKVVLEQYTGLKDKNGKEIYEGDIVKWNEILEYIGRRKEYIGRVYYHENSASFQVNECFYTLGHLRANNVIEVIGNIHENPELLGGEK